MKRTPLKRKTPLRVAGPGKIQRKEDGSGGPQPGSATRKDKAATLSSRVKPIKLMGSRGKRLDPMRERCKREVRRRSGGVCEVPECERTDVAWAHIFGRGNVVSEPLASSPQLTMDLCSIHHDAIDRGFDLDLREQLRWLCVEQVAEVDGVVVDRAEV